MISIETELAAIASALENLDRPRRIPVCGSKELQYDSSYKINQICTPPPGLCAVFASGDGERYEPLMNVALIHLAGAATAESDGFTVCDPSTPARQRKGFLRFTFAPEVSHANDR